MPTKAESRVWYDKYAFLIRIDGVVRAAFQKCSELAAEADTIEYREGGALRADKSPGLVNFEPLTLERGETDDLDLYNWFTTQYKQASDTGGTAKDEYARSMTIEQRNRSGQEVRSWLITNAWVKRYSAGDWDNDASEKKIESVVLEHEGFEMQ